MNRFVIGDPKDCIGCNTCMAACSEVHKAFGLSNKMTMPSMQGCFISLLRMLAPKFSLSTN